MARGSRFDRSANVSATTFATIPSGTTIDANGISLPSSLYSVSYSTSGYKISGGSQAWAGTTLSVAHGMANSLLGFGATHYNPGGVSIFSVFLSNPSPVSTGGVSLSLQGMIAAGAVSLAVSGGTVYWTAFGY